VKHHIIAVLRNYFCINSRF